MEQELVLLEEKPQPAPETVGMKRTYSRAGLSVAALYGTISASGGIAVAVICFVLAALLIVGVLPPIATERLLENPYSVLDYVRSLKGTGVIALLLLIFLLVQAAAWGIGYVIMRLILKKGTPIPKRNLSLGRFLLIVLMCFGVWGVGAVLGNLASFFGVETQEMISTEQFGWEALPFLIYAVIGAPIVEELTFRKALLDRLHDTHEGYAAVVSGLLFGLMHGNHRQFFLAFFLGLLFAMVYQRTGRIIYTMLLHGIINFTATLPELLSLAGVDVSQFWDIAVGALIVAGLAVLLIKRKDPLLHAQPCAVPDANNAVYRNVGMRIVRIAALVLIGAQGTLLVLLGMLEADSGRWLCLIEFIPMALVFLTVLLLPKFTKRYEKPEEEPV